ncbi:MAG TPA: dTDP-4-dehydrorhamnose reductase [Balneolales bacterium]|nr:dTDP-4-dehydrorhamnose reductase [Balneolales bacterium]
MASTYLITGAKGQLGSEWVRELNKRESDFHAYGSDELDITDINNLETIIGRIKPDIIINTAAYTKVDQAEDEPERAIGVNGEGVENLAKISEKYGTRLVHYSTDYVFPGTMKDKFTYPGGYSEEQPTNPINAYGKSKLRGEQVIKQIMSDYLIIRIAWLCGSFGHNFIKTILRLGREKKELKVVNDQYGSPTYTNNVVLNTIALLNANRFGLFHLTSNGLITWFELANEIMNMTGLDTNIIPVTSDEFPAKAKRPKFSKLNTNKIGAVPGVQLIDWKEGLAGLLEELIKTSEQ